MTMTLNERLQHLSNSLSDQADRRLDEAEALGRACATIAEAAGLMPPGFAVSALAARLPAEAREVWERSRVEFGLGQYHDLPAAVERLGYETARRIEVLNGDAMALARRAQAAANGHLVITAREAGDPAWMAENRDTLREAYAANAVKMMDIATLSHIDYYDDEANYSGGDGPDAA